MKFNLTHRLQTGANIFYQMKQFGGHLILYVVYHLYNYFQCFKQHICQQIDNLLSLHMLFLWESRPFWILPA